jgi:hypothetical protein
MENRLCHAVSWSNKRKSKRELKNGFIYVLQCGEYTKVGIAQSVLPRLSSLQTGNPYEIQLLRHWHSFRARPSPRGMGWEGESGRGGLYGTPATSENPIFKCPQQSIGQSESSLPKNNSQIFQNFFLFNLSSKHPQVDRYTSYPSI